MQGLHLRCPERDPNARERGRRGAVGGSWAGEGGRARGQHVTAPGGAERRVARPCAFRSRPLRGGPAGTWGIRALRSSRAAPVLLVCQDTVPKDQRPSGLPTRAPGEGPGPRLPLSLRWLPVCGSVPPVFTGDLPVSVPVSPFCKDTSPVGGEFHAAAV